MVQRRLLCRTAVHSDRGVELEAWPGAALCTTATQSCLASDSQHAIAYEPSVLLTAVRCAACRDMCPLCYTVSLMRETSREPHRAASSQRIAESVPPC